MNIQEILEKLTDEQKRKLLDAAKAEAIESKSKSKEVVENKLTKSNWVSRILGGDEQYTDSQDSKFWSYDRKVTILTFISSLGLISLVDFVPKILVFFIWPSFFWISFMFSRLNQISVIEIPQEEGEDNKNADYIILNSQREDITKNAERAFPFLLFLFIISIFAAVMVSGFYMPYVNTHFPKALYEFFLVIPGYVTFFGYFFITGTPFSVIYKRYHDSFYSHGGSTHKRHEWNSSSSSMGVLAHPPKSVKSKIIVLYFSLFTTQGYSTS
jgi:hypothetical protein